MNLKKIIISGSVFSGKQTALHILDNNQNILDTYSMNLWINNTPEEWHEVSISSAPSSA